MRSITSPVGSRRIAAAVGFLALTPVAQAGPYRPTRTQPSPEPLVVRVEDGGFHWDDAGIGAVAGFGAALVLAGSVALAGRRDRVVTCPDPEKEEQP